MKDKIPTTCTRIISEPGDGTRYDYIMIRNHDVYSIMPYKSTFPFPTKLNYYNVKDIETIEDALEYLKKMKNNSINPHTLLEVIRSVKEDYEKR